MTKYNTDPSNEQLLEVPTQEQAEVVSDVAAVAIAAEVAPTLDKLRGSIRGDNEAVRRIGDTETLSTLQDVLGDPGGHSHDDLLQAMFSNFSGEAYGDIHWSKTSGGWGTPEATTEYGRLREEHPEFDA